MQNVKITDYYTPAIIIELALILTREIEIVEIRRKFHDFSFFFLKPREIFLTYNKFVFSFWSTFFNIFGIRKIFFKIIAVPRTTRLRGP